jgi:capsular polysaccharide transport system permease protein
MLNLRRTGPGAEIIRLPGAAKAPATMRPRWRWLGFVLVVVMPVIAAAIYEFAVAADQFVAEFRFSLHGAEPTTLGSDWFGGAATPSAVDSRVVVAYLHSRTVVDTLGDTLDLRRIFAPPSADWASRLALPASVESLVAFWRGQVEAYYDPGDASVVVQIRAFSPQDALRVAEATVRACETLVNDLSLRLRQDAVRRAEEEVAAARDRLGVALAALRQFRERAGLVDPEKSASADAALAARLRDELAQAKAELSTLRSYMRADAPPVKVLDARIRSLESERQAMASDLGGAAMPGTASPAALSAFGRLDSDRKFAEDAYRHALEGLDRARAEADRQQVYITSFVPPRLPEAPLYPRRWRVVGGVALIAFALWAIGSLALQSIRDHL